MQPSLTTAIEPPGLAPLRRAIRTGRVRAVVIETTASGTARLAILRPEVQRETGAARAALQVKGDSLRAGEARFGTRPFLLGAAAGDTTQLVSLPAEIATGSHHRRPSGVCVALLPQSGRPTSSCVGRLDSAEGESRTWRSEGAVASLAHSTGGRAPAIAADRV